MAIEYQREQGSIIIPLIAVIKEGVRFPLCPLLLQTLRFYRLSLNQCQPNFYRVVMSIDRLNRFCDLNLTYHDINFVYNYCGSLSIGYYFKVQQNRIWLISCLPDSNKNFQGEFLKITGN